MADRTLYDILEVSATASQESIRAAYERLSSRYQAITDSGDADAHTKLDAVKQAFFTLANEERRAQYDKRMQARVGASLHNVEVVEPFWTLPKVIFISLCVIIGSAVYYKYDRDRTRIAAEKAVAETKAKHDAEIAKAEAEKEALALQREREARAADMLQRRERETAIRQYSQETRNDARYNRPQMSAQQREEQRAEQQRRNEEQRAATAARQQLARDRAELCRMERERYGRSISC